MTERLTANHAEKNDLSSVEPRLESIESKLAFQEDAITQLNDALVAQQARIDQLEAAIKALTEALQTQPEDAADTTEPPPPHY
jgi:SlyX protein